jgi:hypothetical protein
MTVKNNMFGNYPNLQIVRSTYTQSINGIDPLPLLYSEPNEDDFTNKFLSTIQNPLITRVCFMNCYNYRQSGIYIDPKYILDSASAVSNQQFKNNLLFSNKIISFLYNILFD